MTIDFEVACDNAAGRAFVQQQLYEEEKAALIGDTVEVTGNRETVSWKVRSDIDDIEVSDPKDTNIGLTGFRFDSTTRGYGDSARIDTSTLFHKVSGRFLEDDIRYLNVHIREVNLERKRRKLRTIKLTSPREVDIFIGMLLVGRLENNTDLWGRRGYGVREETWCGECYCTVIS